MIKIEQRLYDHFKNEKHDKTLKTFNEFKKIIYYRKASIKDHYYHLRVY